MSALAMRVLSAVDGRELDRFQVLNEHRCKHAAIVAWDSCGPTSEGGWAVLLESRCYDWHGEFPLRSTRRSVLRTYSADGNRLSWSRDLGDEKSSYGTELVVLEDIDADGHPDLAASFAEGVEVLSGRTGKSIRRHDMVRDGWAEGLGCALAAPGDLDGDGTDDIVMGQYDAAVYCGAVIAHSGRDGHELWRQLGDDSDDQHHLGYRVVTLADIDGDAVPDFLAGTMHGRAGKPGLSMLISGSKGRVLSSYRRDGARVIATRRP